MYEHRTHTSQEAEYKQILGLNMAYQINIVLPETKDIEIFNAILRACEKTYCDQKMRERQLLHQLKNLCFSAAQISTELENIEATKNFTFKNATYTASDRM